MYDLTTFLTTIAAASASFVAILGGFIASKLIAISTERSEHEDRLKEIDEEVEHRQTIIAEAQRQNDEEDALQFILGNISALVQNRDFDLLYARQEHPDISHDALRPYWNRAIEINQAFNIGRDECRDMNSDNIPVMVAASYRTDDFAYTICQKIGRYYRTREKKEQMGNGFYSLPSVITGDYDLPRVTGIWYAENEKAILQEEHEISLLQLQKKQCEKKRESLLRPKGIIAGLWIFGIFSAMCIILPLIFSPFTTDSFPLFAIVKGIFLLIFTSGLTSVFWYLIWLLKWK